MSTERPRGPRSALSTSREGLEALADRLRTTLGLPAALAILAGLLVGLGMPEIDRLTHAKVPLFAFVDREAARGMLETVASAAISVAGLSFSITVVAFTLSANQLSPRVLRSFRRDPIVQTTLAAFLGTFVYCLVALARLGALGRDQIPSLSIGLAVVLALLSFGLFAVFIGHIVTMLQPSSIISSIGRDARREMRHHFPSGLGGEPSSRARAELAAEAWTRDRPGIEVRHPDEGFLVVVRVGELVELAEREDVFVRQETEVGSFVLPGRPVARFWRGRAAIGEEVEGRIAGLFELGSQRTLPQDPGFPIRQLADVALKGLSPGINDPTTAIDALNEMTALILRSADLEQASPLRTDSSDEPRVLLSVPDLDRLTVAGFSQAMAFSDPDPLVSARIVELLEILRDRAAENGLPHDRIDGLLS